MNATKDITRQDCGDSLGDVSTSSSNMAYQETAADSTLPESGTGATRGRKARACEYAGAECEKLKIKCEIRPGETKCRNCHRRTSTAWSRAKVDLMREDILDIKHATVDSIQDEIRQVKDSLEFLTTRLMLFSNGIGKEQEPSGTPLFNSSSHRRPPTVHDTAGQLTSISPTGLSSTRLDNISMAVTRENSLAGAVTLEEPMGSLYEVTRLRNIRSNKAKTTKPAEDTPGQLDDFISRGVISEHEAEELYNVFHGTLNHYLWVGLEQTHPSFASVRQSSELLTATILTVTALHIPTSAEAFDVCYREFLHLVSSSMFSRYHSVDDVRGLCIAAFWLSDVSWKLSGHAIRIAMELNLYQSSCFVGALGGDSESFFKARLWYMLYVCDHHFSIAYGRPPMIAESFQIREHELFLTSPLAGPLDARILSQVSLMQILTRLYDRFSGLRVRTGGNRQRPEGNGSLPSGNQPDGGPESNMHSSSAGEGDISAAMLLESDLDTLRAYNLEIDQWRMRWFPRQPPSPFICTFTNKGVILYSYFAKLQINSLAIRGVLNAEAILTFVLEEADTRRALVGTPLYVHAMITVACVFLVKAMTKWNRFVGLNVNRGYVLGLLERVVAVLKIAVTSDRHVLKHIASGLAKMLDRMKLVWRNDLVGGGDDFAAATSSQDVIAQHHSAAGSLSYPWGWSTAARYDPCCSAEQKLPPGLLWTPPDMQSGNPQSMPAPSWNSEPYVTPQTQQHQGQGSMDGQEATAIMEDYPMMIDDNFVYKAFGTDTANDVYNLLSSQFSPN
ncbi:hypothetical protein B0J13DRAFT_653439 [Dactylonectria estremocensis]|uniref:Xylanolytic transcriptional activator regulatory domain-containing protein n=1 Tax=Dactylonectria estremocensis TaxID=1079267 RepID=A0A9P9IE59_9HYPO|nr:hypothetical protein B0J13DRAFT_653439 [Dactylonectria estremocensis]